MIVGFSFIFKLTWYIILCVVKPANIIFSWFYIHVSYVYAIVITHYRYLSLYWMMQLQGDVALLHMWFVHNPEGLVPSRLQPGCLRNEAKILP